MKLKCLHGYFKFEETVPGQISDFMKWSGLTLVAKDNFFVFETLQDAPNFSIAGLDLLGVPALETFQGEPWEVFEQNGFVYDFSNDVVVPIESITQLVKIKAAGEVFISSGLILPGSLTESGDRVRDYSAWFSRKTLSWTYTEVAYV